METFQKTIEKMNQFNPLVDIPGAIIMFLLAMIFYVIDGTMVKHGAEIVLVSAFLCTVVCTPIIKFAIYLTFFSIKEIWR